jgi:hypothetical protein
MAYSGDVIQKASEILSHLGRYSLKAIDNGNGWVLGRGGGLDNGAFPTRINAD